jgi:small-conductance mechanosensitive channel
MMSTLYQTVSMALNKALSAFTALLPTLLLALLVFVIGILVAKVTRAIIFKLLGWLSPVLLSGNKKNSVKAFLAYLGFWLVLATFTFWSLKIVNLAHINHWLARFVKFLPQIYLAVLIITLGFIISRVLRANILKLSVSRINRLIANILSILTFSIAILSGLEQLAINTYLINQLFVIAFSLAFGAMMLVFVMASYPTLQSMLTARSLHDSFDIGQYIQIGEYSGRIEAITHTSVQLVEQGIVIILPVSLFLTHPTTVITEPSND